MTELKSIYLAGPDVFFVDAEDHFTKLEALCLRFGLRGVRPSDGGLSSGFEGPGPVIAQRIYEANMDLIRGCDGVLANLMPFRGKLEPDSGTVFEVGVAVALGKPVAGYFPECAELFEHRVIQACGVLPEKPGAPLFDATYGYMVESFQQPLNLMLSRSSALYATAEQALEHLREHLRAQSKAGLAPVRKAA
jgi:nucleoside 2-deoxyribosyltransferase